MPERPRRVGRRLSDDEVLLRREDVELAMVREQWNSKRRSKLCAKWAVSDSQLWKDRTVILNEWQKMSDEPPEAHRARLSRRMQYLFGQAMRWRDLHPAIRASREEALLLGAHAPKQVDVKVSGSVTLKGTEALAKDPVAHAKALLDPGTLAWARAVLTQAGEEIPGVIDVPLLPAPTEP